MLRSPRKLTIYRYIWAVATCSGLFVLNQTWCSNLRKINTLSHDNLKPLWLSPPPHFVPLYPSLHQFMIILIFPPSWQFFTLIYSLLQITSEKQLHNFWVVVNIWTQWNHPLLSPDFFLSFLYYLKHYNYSNPSASLDQ